MFFALDGPHSPALQGGPSKRKTDNLGEKRVCRRRWEVRWWAQGADDKVESAADLGLRDRSEQVAAAGGELVSIQTAGEAS